MPARLSTEVYNSDVRGGETVSTDKDEDEDTELHYGYQGEKEGSGNRGFTAFIDLALRDTNQVSIHVDVLTFATVSRRTLLVSCRSPYSRYHADSLLGLLLFQEVDNKMHDDNSILF